MTRVPDDPEAADATAEMALARYLVGAADRAAAAQAFAAADGRAIDLVSALRLVEAHQRDRVGEMAARFLADAAERGRWRFIPGVGFLGSDADPW